MARPLFDWENPAVWIDTIKKYFKITPEILDAEKRMNNFYYNANTRLPQNEPKVSYLSPVFERIARDAYGALKIDPGSPIRIYSIKEDIDQLKSIIRPPLANSITQVQKNIEKFPDENIKNDMRQRIQYETMLVNAIDGINMDMLPILAKDSKLARLEVLSTSPFPRAKAIHDFQKYGEEDAVNRRQMDKNIINLAGTDNDYLAKAYNSTYASVMMKKRGGKSRKSSKKSRKTRRVKKLNGR